MSPRPAQPIAQDPPFPLEWLQRIVSDLSAYKAKCIRVRKGR